MNLEVGDYFEACSFHIVKATEVDIDDDYVEGDNLTKGTVSACSIFHCGIEKLTKDQAEILIAKYNQDPIQYMIERTASYEAGDSVHVFLAKQ